MIFVKLSEKRDFAKLSGRSVRWAVQIPALAPGLFIQRHSTGAKSKKTGTADAPTRAAFKFHPDGLRRTQVVRNGTRRCTPPFPPPRRKEILALRRGGSSGVRNESVSNGGNGEKKALSLGLPAPSSWGAAQLRCV